MRPAPALRGGSVDLAFNDDILAEIFRRADGPRSLLRCSIGCKRFFRIISSLRTSFMIGFYHSPVYNPSLPTYVRTVPEYPENQNLNLQFLRPTEKVQYELLESRGGRVLLLKMIDGPELHFVLLNPFDMSRGLIEPVPPQTSYDPIKHRLVACSYVPMTNQRNGKFKIVLVYIVRKTKSDFTVMSFCSESRSWTIREHDVNDGVVFPKREYVQCVLQPTILAGRMLYSLQSRDYILAIDPSTLRLSKIDLPISGYDILIYGNHNIGRTEEGELCFFFMKKFNLHTWVYDNTEWIEQETVDLHAFMDPDEMGEVASMKFSADVLDQFSGYKWASMNGFGEETCVLILVLRDWVVSFDIRRKKMKMLYHSNDLLRRVQTVYPYEMEWPPFALPVFQENDEMTENAG